jgi:hypothetical protein
MTIKAGSQEYPLGMAHTRNWQDLVGVQSDSAVPLNQIQCPFCGVGEELNPNARNPSASASVVPNGDWQKYFTVLDQQSFEPHGEAFKWSDEFLPRKYGVLTLSCKQCRNSFFVHYLLRHSELKSGLGTSRFWSRLIVPNIDFVDFEDARWSDYQRISELLEENGRQKKYILLWQMTVIVSFILGALIL